MEPEIVPFPVFYEQIERLGFILAEGEVSFMYNMAIEAARTGQGYTHPIETLGGSPVKCTVDCHLQTGSGVTGFEPRLYILPEYVATTVGKIDVGKLEEQFRTLSWRLEDQNRKYLPEIFGSVLQLEQAGSKGRTVADALMLKYWLGTPVEKYINLSTVKLKYGRKEYFSVAGNSTDFTIQEAEALLSGRPVFKGFEQNRFDPVSGEWTELSFTLLQGSMLKERHNYPGYDIAARLLELPFMEKPSQREITGGLGLLLAGNSIPVELEVSGRGQLVYISADPRRKGISIRDVHGVELNAATLISGRIQRLEKELKGRKGQHHNNGRGKGPGM